MATYRQSVREYIRACEALIATGDLSDHEQQSVEEMMIRLSERLFPSGNNPS